MRLVSAAATFIVCCFSVAVFSNPNARGWELLMGNNPYEARNCFSKNIDNADKTVAGEAFRGLSEVCAFLGEDIDAVRYYLKGGLVEKNAALVSAGIMHAYQFSNSAWGPACKEGYELLSYFSKKPGIMRGEFDDLLAQRYLNDGHVRAARRIVSAMGCIKTWMMIGPFDNISNCGYNNIYPPEEKVELSKIYQGKDGNLTKWHTVDNTAATGWIFTENHTGATNAVFYFYCTVTSDRERPVNLSFGASGAFKVFVNGAVVLADSVFRNTGIDMFMRRVIVTKGDNAILVKLCHESSSTWTDAARLSNFNLRFLDDCFTPVTGLTATTAAANMPKGDPGEHGSPGSPIPYTPPAPSPFGDSIIVPLQEKLRKNNRDIDAALLCMRGYNGMDKTDEGQKLAKAFLEIYPKSSLWHQLYGESLLRSKKLTESQNELKTAFTLCGFNRSAWSNELHSITKTVEPRKILEFIEQAPEIFSASSEALLAAIDAHMKLGNRAEAVNKINELIKNHATDYAAVVALAGWYMESGEVRKAQKIMKAYLEHDRTNVSMYLTLATASLKQGNAAKAVALLREGLDYSPENAQMYYSIASIYYSKKKYKKAMEYIEKCCVIVPADAKALNLKGNILISLEKTEDALAAFNDAIRFTNDDFNAWENVRVLENRPTLESLAPLPPVDSVVGASEAWIDRNSESGAVLSLVKDIFFYPSRCSQERTFMVVNLPTQDAIDSWKERTIGYNDYFQNLSIERALSYTSNGTQVQADIMDNKIVFKSLQPGDCIVLEWSLKNYYSGEMARHVCGDEDFDYSCPVFESRLRLITPVADTIHYNVFGDSIDIAAAVHDDYRVTQLSRGPYKNPIEETFSATDWPQRRKVNYSTFTGWSDIVKWYDELTRHKLDNTIELKAIADSLFATCTTPAEKVARMHGYITGTIRYSYVPFRQSDWIPQDAHDVLATKIGDCKDMASLGKSLLDRAGIPAFLVLVNTEIRHDVRHAFVGPNFNHCILCYTFDGKDRFVDLTDNNLSLSTLPKDDQGALALIIRPGQRSLITLPCDKPENRVKTRSIIYEVDTGGSLSERGAMLRTGIYAAQYREIFRFQSEEKRRSTMHKILARSYPNLTLDTLAFDSMLNTVSDSLTYRYAFHVDNAATLSGATAILPLHIPDIINPDEYPMENKRRFPVDLYQADYDICSVATRGQLVFPKKWRPITLPEKVSLRSSWGEYVLEFTHKVNTIGYSRKVAFSFNAPVPVDRYDQLRAFLNAISKADAVQLLFFTK